MCLLGTDSPEHVSVQNLSVRSPVGQSGKHPSCGFEIQFVGIELDRQDDTVVSDNPRHHVLSISSVHFLRQSRICATKSTPPSTCCEEPDLPPVSGGNRTARRRVACLTPKRAPQTPRLRAILAGMLQFSSANSENRTLAFFYNRTENTNTQND